MIELLLATGVALAAYGTYGLMYSTSDLPSLLIEPAFIPIPMHYLNVRAAVTAEQWKQIATVTHNHSKFGYGTCQVCKQNGKTQGFSWPVECHEVWSFDFTTRTMKLTGLMSLCPLCHKGVHYLRTKNHDKQYFKQMQKHFLKVNNISQWKLKRYVRRALKIAKTMNGEQWKLDLTYLNENRFKHIFINRRFTNDERNNCRKKEIF